MSNTVDIHGHCDPRYFGFDIDYVPIEELMEGEDVFVL